ncbi:group 1 truncated hemoglobin [Micromonospora sp. NPDC049559]|uniref:group I truncated hemoglobin n=1 Tax=Micromonospora sp. NPDC049559 TaxID=3155923 RepID=UPI0034400824
MTETGSSSAESSAVDDAANSGQSHYQRIGGSPAIKLAVDQFYERVLADPDLTGYFEKVDLEQLRRHQVLMLTTVLGGPNGYTGRPLAEAHQPLNIPVEHYAKVGGHLHATLAGLGVPADILADVQTVLAQVQDQVVANRT